MSTNYLYHYTYLITNLSPISIERYYIGVRSCNCLPENDPYMSSSKYLKEAIKTQNKNQFEKVIIEICESRDKAVLHEIWLHNEYNVGVNCLFYNKVKQTSKGFDCTGITLSIETKKKMSEAHKNRTIYHTGPVKRNKIFNKNKGSHLTEEHKYNIAKGQKESMTEDRKKRISNSIKGKVMSEKTKQRISETRKRLIAEGKIKYTSGKIE